MNRNDPSVVAWFGHNARYARDLAAAQDDEARGTVREVLDATADPEYTVLVNSPAFESSFEDELDSLGGFDFWLSLRENNDWAKYDPPEKQKSVVLSGDPSEMKSLASARGLDEDLADGLARAIEKGEIHEVQILRRMDGDRVASVAMVTSTWDHHENVGELPRIHLYRGATQTAWTVANLPSATPSTTIVDVFPLDRSGQNALVVTDREGYFRTSDGGVRWQPANFNEPRLQNGRAVKTIIVGADVYSLAILNKNPGDDENPLFRLARRTWLQRWRIGVGRWVDSPKR